MKTLTENRWIAIETESPVYIPTADGKSVAETIMVKVPGWKDPESGEIYLDGEALEMLDKVKARRMGLLLPTELREMRSRFGLSQSAMSELLGVGKKTYTRWERGRDRPTQSMNTLLLALWRGHLNPASLKAQRQPRFSWLDRPEGCCPCDSDHKPRPIDPPTGKDDIAPPTGKDDMDENFAAAA